MSKSWINKAWAGISKLDGENVWSDGSNIFYSTPTKSYILNGDTWVELNEWSGDGYGYVTGNYVWSDGTNVYYSPGETYIIDTANYSLTELDLGEYYIEGNSVFSDGTDVYYLYYDQKLIWDKSNHSWSEISGWDNIGDEELGQYVWSDGTDIYYSRNGYNFKFNKSTKTWTAITFDTFNGVEGNAVWSDGSNVYYSGDDGNYIFDKANNSWSSISWSGIASLIGGKVWNDLNSHTYYSENYSSSGVTHDRQLEFTESSPTPPSSKKTFVSNEDANSLFGKVGERLGLRPKTFTGTHSDWHSLSLVQQAEYEYVNFTDDSESAIEALPKLFVYADNMPETKTNVDCRISFSSRTLVSTTRAAKIKCQGTSSMSYPKKNYTLTFADMPFDLGNGWGPQFVYCLKANYIDHSHMRNIISGQLWKNVMYMCKSEGDTIPNELFNSPGKGAVDGFPFKMYVNGKYEGIYTFNIPKAAWMFGMDEANSDHVALCAESNSHSPSVATACNFKKLWDGIDGSDWSIEVGSNSQDLVESVNAAIGFVMNSTDAEFIDGINDYFDINNIITYYAFAYYINALDNLGKNMIMLTYDKQKWYLSPYDLDSTYGNFYDGSHMVPYDYKCPQDYEEAYNRLFERVCDLFPLELKARYNKLRQSVFTYETLTDRAERFYSKIGYDFYAQDVVEYPGIPNPSGNNVWQIINYMAARTPYVDSYFNSLVARVACTDISITGSSMTISIGSTGSIAANVVKTPANATDRVFYISSDPLVVRIDDFGNYVGIAEGTATITVTCDGHSDTMSIVVSGASYISVEVPMTNTTGDWWESSYDPSEYIALPFAGASFYLPGITDISEVDVFMYDENKTQLSVTGLYNYSGRVFITDPAAEYLRITLNDTNHGTHDTLTVMIGGLEISNSAVWSAGILDTTTGVITADATSHDWFSQAINIVPGNTLASTCLGEYSYNCKGGVLYDSSMNYLETIGLDNLHKDDYEVAVSNQNAAYIKLMARDMDVDTKNPSGKVRFVLFNKNYS